MALGGPATGDGDQVSGLEAGERAAAVLLYFIVQDGLQTSLASHTSKVVASVAVLHPSADLSKLRARVRVRALALPGAQWSPDAFALHCLKLWLVAVAYFSSVLGKHTTPL